MRIIPKAVILLILATLIQACTAEFYAKPNGEVGIRIMNKAMYVVSESDIATFNAANAELSLSQSDVSFVSTSGEAYVGLLSGANTIDSALFPYSRTGTTIKFSNAPAVTNWVRSHTGMGVNGIELNIEDQTLQAHLGTNVVTAEIRYNNTILAGVSGSQYYTELPHCTPNPLHGCMVE